MKKKIKTIYVVILLFSSISVNAKEADISKELFIFSRGLSYIIIDTKYSQNDKKEEAIEDLKNIVKPRALALLEKNQTKSISDEKYIQFVKKAGLNLSDPFIVNGVFIYTKYQYPDNLDSIKMFFKKKYNRGKKHKYKFINNVFNKWEQKHWFVSGYENDQLKYKKIKFIEFFK